MDKNNLIKRIQAATKKAPCDLVIKNITVVDVFQNSTFVCDVGISDNYFVGLGEYSGLEEIDGTGKFICPSLIDGHAHIESSLLTPKEYYKAALLHGITSIVADPHEIANVLGIDGINFMIDSSKNIPFDFYFMLSSCVPATTFESSGANLTAKDLKPLYSNKKVLGLAEVMNYPAVLDCQEDMLEKLIDAINNNSVIDGHCAGFNNDMINAYRVANIKTDHESITTEELTDRVRRGMYVLMREGSVAKNLKELIKGASVLNSRRLCLCTDDKHIDDIIKSGGVDYSIKLCIENGIKAETAIQMATLNTAECYNLNDKGAIAPGYIADFLILDDLNKFTISSVYKNGKLVVKDNALININDNKEVNTTITSSINIPALSLEDFKIDLRYKNFINIIELISNKLESNHLKIKIDSLTQGDNFIPLTNEKDLIKVAVIERHNATGNIGLGIIKGLQLKKGAIATSVAHDSHNLIVCGTTDEDMLFAVNELKKIGGGIIVVENGVVLASIKLEIGGLITARKIEEVLVDLENLHQAIHVVAPEINFNPFLTLSFLSLPVIPEIKITDKGLFDVKNFRFIPVAE